jgi:hypothetical protein
VQRRRAANESERAAGVSLDFLAPGERFAKRPPLPPRAVGEPTVRQALIDMHDTRGARLRAAAICFGAGAGLLSARLVAGAAALAALGVDQSVYLTVAALDVGADFLLRLFAQRARLLRCLCSHC